MIHRRMSRPRNIRKDHSTSSLATTPLGPFTLQRLTRGPLTRYVQPTLLAAWQEGDAGTQRVYCILRVEGAEE